MSQNLQNFVKFQKFQLENLVDFEKCCKTHIYLQKSEPIQPKTSIILPKFCQPTLSDVSVAPIVARSGTSAAGAACTSAMAAATKSRLGIKLDCILAPTGYWDTGIFGPKNALFGCKNRLRYSRERALQSLADRAVQTAQATLKLVQICRGC